MKKVISFDKEILFPTMIGEITAISLDQTLKFLSKNDIEGDFIISGRYKMTEASAIEEDFKYTLPIEITMAETFTLDTTKIEIKDFYYEIIDEEILKVKIDIQVEGVEEVLLEEDITEVVEKEMARLDSSVEEAEENRKEVVMETIEKEKNREEVSEDFEKEVEETISSEAPPLEVIEPSIQEELLRECDGEEKTREEKLSDIEPLPKNSLKEETKEVQKEEKEIEEKDTLDAASVSKNVEEVSVQTLEKKEEVSANIQSIFRVFNDAEETYKTYTVYIMRKNDTINSVMDRYQITKEQLEEYNDLSQIELGSKVIIPTTYD